ncbi:MAG: HD domain-containing protein [Flavobacteriaceae bacterium]|nr:HD domain-containing protein [Flavobacteriaceae bacterium]
MSNLIKKSKNFVLDLFHSKLGKGFVYHSISHTMRVVKATNELAIGESLSDKDTQLIMLAAWFHDSGYTKGYKDHEKNSVIIAKEFLKDTELNDDDINIIESCIMSTKMGNKPKGKLQNIMSDADSSHLKSKNYLDISGLLREECKSVGGKEFTDLEWIEGNISFFSNKHRFYTDYALDNWQDKKEKNLFILVEEKRNAEKETSKNKKKVKVKQEKSFLPEKGVETMFRVTLRNHLSLSAIADTKANILLSVNAIILSLALAEIVPRLDNPSNSHLVIPTLVLVTSCLATIVLSILATRPQVTEGVFTQKDIEDKKVNLLFFGNFHKMPLEKFDGAMIELMKDKEYLYKSMTKDLYFLGKVLHKKYKILRVTYVVFMIGIILSVFMYAISFYWVPEVTG